MAGVPTPGEVLAGKYRVEGVLGQGGMGVVLAARHVLLDQRVAVKLLLASSTSAKDSTAMMRLVNEARAAARLTSEHVARSLDAGVLDDGRVYMVMELLEGEDLDAMVRRRGALPITEAVDYVLEALDALAEAHAAGIIHRDLKPSNVFIARRKDGTPIAKVVDFGISKVEDQQLDRQSAALTSTQDVMGSPLYMSPEQAKSSKTVDARTDIWSIAAVLYEIIVGRPPFEGDSVGALFAVIFEGAYTRASAVRPDVPPGLDDVIARCFQVKRDARFSSAAELGLALAPFGSGTRHATLDRLRVRAGSAPFAATVANSDPALRVGSDPRLPTSQPRLAGTANAWEREPSPRPRRSIVLPVALVSVAVLGVLGAGGYWKYGRVTPPAPAAMTAEPPVKASTEPAPPLPAASERESATESASAAASVASSATKVATAPPKIVPHKAAPSAKPTANSEPSLETMRK